MNVWIELVESLESVRSNVSSSGNDVRYIYRLQVTECARTFSHVLGRRDLLRRLFSVSLGEDCYFLTPSRFSLYLSCKFIGGPVWVCELATLSGIISSISFVLLNFTTVGQGWWGRLVGFICRTVPDIWIMFSYAGMEMSGTRGCRLKCAV